ncbi:MAG TPA: uroporphyrinogen-III C-methyltransferase [Pseudomonadales bacterium]
MSDASLPPQDSGEALARPQSRGRKERRAGAGVIVSTGVLIALAATGWLGWQQMELQRDVAALSAGNAELQQREGIDTSLLADIQQRQQALDTALQQRDGEFDTALQQRAQELEAALRATSQEILRQTQERAAESNVATTAQAERLALVERNLTALRRDLGRRETDGVPLAEAELLLRFAQQRLLVARDTQAAIALYRQADEILRGVDDAAVFAVRDALARELAALEAVPPIDVPGLFARLGGLSARVADFNVAVDGAVQDFSVQPIAGDTALSGWWENAKQSLGRYFVVTRSATDIAPQLDSGEQFLLRTLVQLHIEQARIALLSDEPELYRAALDDARTVAQRWMRGEGSALDDFLAALAELRDTAIVSDLPEGGAALAALEQVTSVGPRAAQADAPGAAARTSPAQTNAEAPRELPPPPAETPAEPPAPTADAPQ